jgi:EmrB/QacA subfamily drug resistance transporter
MLAAILGSGIVFLDSTVVNVALQRIGTDLPSHLFAPLEGESYVYNGYLLSLSALLILAGALADARGRRRFFVIGLIGFGVTSTLCAIAPTLEVLVLCRLAQGAAGALLVPGSLAILTSSLEGEDLGRAFGLWAGASGATTILGPVLGGVLVEEVSWRAVFLINLPLILVALWATYRHVPESRDPRASGQFDWAGAALAAVAVGGLSFGAIYGQQRDWRGIVGPLAIAIGAAASLAFVTWMARGRHPLVPLGFFRSRNFSVTNASTFLIYGALYVSTYEMAIFVQGTLGYTATAAGFLSVPGSVLLILFSSRVGRLGARFGPRWFMAAGPALMAIGLLWLIRVPPDSAAWVLRPGDAVTWIPSVGYLVDFLPGVIVFGAGLAIMVAPLTTALMTSLPRENAGIASAVNNAISRVGPQLIGACVFVAITVSFYSDLGSRLPGVDTASAQFRQAVAPLNPLGASASPQLALAARAASTDAFHLAMATAAILLLAGAAINALGIRDQATVPADLDA